MKKKLILSCLTLLIAGSVFSTHAKERDGDDGGPVEVGGGDPKESNKCEAPLSNVCYKVYKNGVLISTEKGVLHVH